MTVLCFLSVAANGRRVLRDHDKELEMETEHIMPQSLTLTN